MFDERSDEEGPTADAVTGASKTMLEELESEIGQLKRHLQDTIERSDASNEELKASNEELQAINEELRSASEELETSKEELQSMNEELVTVNYELKNKVEETAQINDDLQNLIASSDLPVVFVDAGMHIKRFTPRATDLFNLIPGDVGRSLLDIRHRLDTETLSADADEAFKTLRPIEREVRADTGRIYLSRMVPYRTGENRIEGAVMTFLDITSRVNAERIVRVNEARLRAATRTRDFAIITMGAHGEVETWNPGAERVFGYTEAEMLGQSFEVLFSPEERANGTPDAELDKARADGSVDDDRWHLRKDGTRVFARGVTTAYTIGDARGFAKIVRDDTASKTQDDLRTREHIRQGDLLREVETAARVKDEFLAVMSHELKHPLNLIHVNAELLTNVPSLRDAPVVRRAAEAIRTAVAGQARIIDDLLDLSRARTGKMTLTIEAIRIDEIVNRIVGAMRSQAVERGIELVEAIDRADGFVVMGDLIRVEQIVWNLLSNAFKFTGSGGTVTVRLSHDAREAVLEVTDTGRGIDPKALPRIFSMFSQEVRSSDGVTGGMGIGLALVKELIEAQGGTIEASSLGVNRGATFTARFPRGDGAAVTPDANPEDSLRDVRILLVDDMPSVLAPFAELMGMVGARVTTATSGADALELLEAQPFDVLVSDVGMPGMDGYQLIDAVRQSKGLNADITAIALTGYGRPGDAQRALQVGFDAHLPKPTPIEDLIETVARLRPGTR